VSAGDGRRLNISGGIRQAMMMLFLNFFGF